MSADDVKLRAMGDTAFAVEFGTQVDRAVNARVMALHRVMVRQRPPGVIETIPSFGALVISYDPLATSAADLQADLRQRLRDLVPGEGQGRLWQIPVCYDSDLAPDLHDVAARCGVDPADVVRSHSSTRFFIYMLGFMPGLAYMGGLEARLQLPRRREPRLKVPAGSVAIAEAMTTIYPWESPGGWHLIGRTPVRLFDRDRPEPILYGAGDEVEFRAISRAEFEALAADIARGAFDPVALEVRR